MQKDAEANYLARRQEDDLTLSLTSPNSNAADAHTGLANGYRAKLDALGF